MRIGLISDTHGVLRPEVFDHFAGVERILHAGDIGPADLLVELEVIAPVTAVRGNTDGFEIRARVPAVAALELAGRRTVVVHGDQFGTPTPPALRAAYPAAEIIIFGHTHRPVVDRAEGRLVVNPGAAGPRRFKLRPTIGLLTLGAEADDVEVELIEL
jgi:putative phosphoesterase